MKLNEHMYEHMYEQDTKIIRWMAMTKYHRLLKWPTISSGKAFRERLEGYGSPDWLWEVGHGPVATVFPLGDPKNNSENCKGIYSFAFRFLTLRWWSWKTKAKRIKDDQKKGWSESSNVINMRDMNGILMGYSKMGAMWATSAWRFNSMAVSWSQLARRFGSGEGWEKASHPHVNQNSSWDLFDLESFCCRYSNLVQLLIWSDAFGLIRCGFQADVKLCLGDSRS